MNEDEKISLSELKPNTKIISFKPSLKSLNLSYQNLTSLPALPPQLETLIINNNKLTELPALPSTLIYLLCQKNLLTELPLLPQSLKVLKAKRNQIIKFEGFSKLPPYMKNLEIQENFITHLPQVPKKINSFKCQSNHISSFINFPLFCQNIDISSNSIKVLPFINDCKVMKCDFNPLRKLPNLPKSLVYLRANNCQLTSLPNLPEKLEFLQVSNNKLQHLPLLPNSIRFLGIFNNTKPLKVNQTLPDSIYESSVTITSPLRSISFKKSKINLLKLKKGTALFRGLTAGTNPLCDFYGAFNVNSFYLYPNYNVFFYPYPFGPDILSTFDTMVIYYLNHDVEVELNILPSKNTGNLFENDALNSHFDKCSNIEISSVFSGRSYDRCYDEKFLKENPYFAGAVSMNIPDSTHFINAALSESKIQDFTQFSIYTEDASGNIGIPEIMLHPRRKRVESEMVTENSKDSSLQLYENIMKHKEIFNYTPIYTSKHTRFTKDQYYRDVLRMLSPKGYLGKGETVPIQLIVDEETKFFRIKSKI